MTGQRSGSSKVAAGIAFSRVFGLIREVLIAATFGISGAGDAFRYAMRIPNVIQNLLGEGALGASFVPVYAKLIEERNESEARRVAGGVLGLLSGAILLIVAVLVILADPIISIFARGLVGETHDLAVSLTRITAVGIGFLGISAWALAVLNSHRQYFLGYAAPALWNLAQIILLGVVAIIGLVANNGGPETDTIAVWLAIAVVVGSVLQLGVMIPRVRVLTQGATPHLRREGEVATVLRRFGPAVGARGVIQISSLIDGFLASFLAAGALSTIALALPLYLLPISVFGFSVATAELTEMSRRSDQASVVAGRVQLGLRKVSLAAGLSAAVLFFGGRAIAATLYQWPNEILGRSSISSDDSIVLGWTLAAYALALPAAMSARVTQNALYALGEVSKPARIAVIRVVVTIVVAVLVIFQADRITVIDGVMSGWSDLGSWPLWDPLSEDIRTDKTITRAGPIGLGLAALVSAWVEWILLRRALETKIGTSAKSGLALPIFAAAFAAGIVIWSIQVWLPLGAPIEGMVIGGAALVTYIGLLRFQGFRPRTSPRGS
ncbi:MAG: putative peptidoglycan lipid II flippase [Acidimicrobiales bacterium]